MKSTMRIRVVDNCHHSSHATSIARRRRSPVGIKSSFVGCLLFILANSLFLATSQTFEECEAEMAFNDFNNNGVLKHVEFANFVHDISPFAGCPNLVEHISEFVPGGRYYDLYRQLSCVCVIYDDDANCCDEMGVRIPSAVDYGPSYTTAVCTAVLDELTLQCQDAPSTSPSSAPPSPGPIVAQTLSPNAKPTVSPSASPTPAPSASPSLAPIPTPTVSPTASIVAEEPTVAPSTAIAVDAPIPTAAPSSKPTVVAPSVEPTTTGILNTDTPTAGIVVQSATPTVFKVSGIPSTVPSVTFVDGEESASPSQAPSTSSAPSAAAVEATAAPSSVEDGNIFGKDQDEDTDADDDIDRDINNAASNENDDDTMDKLLLIGLPSIGGSLILCVGLFFLVRHRKQYAKNLEKEEYSSTLLDDDDAFEGKKHHPMGIADPIFDDDDDDEDDQGEPLTEMERGVKRATKAALRWSVPASQLGKTPPAPDLVDLSSTAADESTSVYYDDDEDVLQESEESKEQGNSLLVRRVGHEGQLDDLREVDEDGFDDEQSDSSSEDEDEDGWRDSDGNDDEDSDLVDHGLDQRLYGVILPAQDGGGSRDEKADDDVAHATRRIGNVQQQGVDTNQRPLGSSMRMSAFLSSLRLEEVPEDVVSSSSCVPTARVSSIPSMASTVASDNDSVYTPDDQSVISQSSGASTVAAQLAASTRNNSISRLPQQPAQHRHDEQLPTAVITTTMQQSALTTAPATAAPSAESASGRASSLRLSAGGTNPFLPQSRSSQSNISTGVRRNGSGNFARSSRRQTSLMHASMLAGASGSNLGKGDAKSHSGTTITISKSASNTSMSSAEAPTELSGEMRPYDGSFLV